MGSTVRIAPALSLTAVQLALATGWAAYVLFLPEIVGQRLGFGPQGVRVVLVADQLLFLVCQPIAGVLSDAAKRAWRTSAPVWIAGALASVFFLVLVGLLAGAADSSTAWRVTLLAGVLAWVALSTAVKVPTLALIREVAGVARGDDGRAIVAGAVATALGLSVAIPPLFGNPIRKLGAAGMFVAASLTLLVAIGATWAAMRGRTQVDEPPGKAERGNPLNVILLVVVGGLATLGARLGTMVMAGARLGKGLPAEDVAIVLGGIGLFGALAGVPAGWIARRAGPALPLLIGVGLGLIGSLALTLPPGLMSGWIVAATFGIGGSCYVAGALTAVLSQAGTRHSGAAVGALLAAESLAAAAQILAAPYLAPRLASQPALVLLAAAALAMALLPAGVLALRLMSGRPPVGT